MKKYVLALLIITILLCSLTSCGCNKDVTIGEISGNLIVREIDMHEEIVFNGISYVYAGKYGYYFYRQSGEPIVNK